MPQQRKHGAVHSRPMSLSKFFETTPGGEISLLPSRPGEIHTILTLAHRFVLLLPSWKLLTSLPRPLRTGEPAVGFERHGAPEVDLRHGPSCWAEHSPGAGHYALHASEGPPDRWDPNPPALLAPEHSLIQPPQGFRPPAVALRPEGDASHPRGVALRPGGGAAPGTRGCPPDWPQASGLPQAAYGLALPRGFDRPPGPPGLPPPAYPRPVVSTEPGLPLRSPLPFEPPLPPGPPPRGQPRGSLPLDVPRPPPLDVAPPACLRGGSGGLHALQSTHTSASTPRRPPQQEAPVAPQPPPIPPVSPPPPPPPPQQPQPPLPLAPRPTEAPPQMGGLVLQPAAASQAIPHQPHLRSALLLPAVHAAAPLQLAQPPPLSPSPPPHPQQPAVLGSAVVAIPVPARVFGGQQHYSALLNPLGAKPAALAPTSPLPPPSSMSPLLHAAVQSGEVSPEVSRESHGGSSDSGSVRPRLLLKPRSLPMDPQPLSGSIYLSGGGSIAEAARAAEADYSHRLGAAAANNYAAQPGDQGHQHMASPGGGCSLGSTLGFGLERFPPRLNEGSPAATSPEVRPRLKLLPRGATQASSPAAGASRSTGSSAGHGVPAAPGGGIPDPTSQAPNGPFGAARPREESRPHSAHLGSAAERPRLLLQPPPPPGPPPTSVSRGAGEVNVNEEWHTVEKTPRIKRCASLHFCPRDSPSEGAKTANPPLPAVPQPLLRWQGRTRDGLGFAACVRIHDRVACHDLHVLRDRSKYHNNI